jgi:hypothetical protein
MKGINDMQDDLDRILSTRFAPPMRSHLAERIIDAAKPRAMREALQGRSIIELFQELFMIPQPVYVLSLMLIVGLSAGISASSLDDLQGDATTDKPTDLASFIDMDDGFDMGEWL